MPPSPRSMGRLFDGVAALCGLPAVASFEGQAAMALQFAAQSEAFSTAAAAGSDKLNEDAGDAAYPLPLLPGDAGRGRLGAVAPRSAGRSGGGRERRPHRTRAFTRLADLALAIARLAGGRPPAHAGGRPPGCAQRRLLPKWTVDGVNLRAGCGPTVLRSSRTTRVPPGDGGIAGDSRGRDTVIGHLAFTRRNVVEPGA